MNMMQRIKAYVARATPGSVGKYRSATYFLHRFMHQREDMAAIFTPFYTANAWGDAESVSGPGSNFERTARLRQALPSLLTKLQVSSLLDAPCGDFNWMKYLDLPLQRYVGADVVSHLITKNQKLYGDGQKSFIVLDITTDTLPQVDVILCRDCLIHFSNRHIAAAIQNFKRSGSTYLLVSTYPGWQQNEDVQTGGFRYVNLQLPPFNFPTPAYLLREKYGAEDALYFGKSLGLWKLQDIAPYP